MPTYTLQPDGTVTKQEQVSQPIDLDLKKRRLKTLINERDVLQVEIDIIQTEFVEIEKQIPGIIKSPKVETVDIGL